MGSYELYWRTQHAKRSAPTPNSVLDQRDLFCECRVSLFNKHATIHAHVHVHVHAHVSKRVLCEFEIVTKRNALNELHHSIIHLS